MRPSILGAGLVVILTACTPDDLTVAQDPALLARATRDSLFVTNLFEEPVYLFLADADELALMSYAVCATRQECGAGLGSGATLRIANRNVLGGQNGVRRISIGAWVFRIAHNGTDSVVGVANLQIAVP